MTNTNAATADEADGGPRDRPFEPWRQPRTDAARAVVADVLTQLQSYERHKRLRQRRRRAKDQAVFEQTVAAIVCDLAHRTLTEPEGWLAVPLSKEVLGRKGNGRAPILGDTFPTALERMAAPEMAFVEIRKGDPGYGIGRARRTTIRAGARLRARVVERGLALRDLGRRPAQEGEVIVLKRAKESFWDAGDGIAFAETEETRRLRDQMLRINRWLEAAEIDFDETAAPGRVVDVGDRLLRRVFNDGCFNRGGRLFGGFWQPLRKRERLDGILIDEERVCSLDFGQMAARMLYGMAGAEPPPGDAYAIPGLERADRDGRKQLFNALLNTTSPPSRFPQGTRKAFPKWMKVTEAVEAITAHHRPIAAYFHAGIGLELMFRESEIMVEILLTLADRGIVGLPVHDALIVRSSDVEQAKAVMLSTYRRHTGVEGVVEVER